MTKNSLSKFNAGEKMILKGCLISLLHCISQV
jgi:hypothetical protein